MPKLIIQLYVTDERTDPYYRIALLSTVRVLRFGARTNLKRRPYLRVCGRLPYPFSFPQYPHLSILLFIPSNTHFPLYFRCPLPLSLFAFSTLIYPTSLPLFPYFPSHFHFHLRCAFTSALKLDYQNCNLSMIIALLHKCICCILINTLIKNKNISYLVSIVSCK